VKADGRLPAKADAAMATKADAPRAKADGLLRAKADGLVRAKAGPALRATAAAAKDARARALGALPRRVPGGAPTGPRRLDTASSAARASAAEVAGRLRRVARDAGIRTSPVVRRGLPVAGRAIRGVRDWALAPGAGRPVVGRHRRPGTLPIESWLLIGRRRQQGLLVALIAAAMLLIAIPGHQSSGPGALDSAAARAAAHGARQPGAAHPRGHKPGAGQPAVTPPPGGIPGGANGRGTSATAAAALPHGTGPARSLRRTGSAAVALTFDDGPDPVQTPQILALLTRYHVKATFCLVGRNVVRHPDIVRMIAAAGHTLCNHTFVHSVKIGDEEPAAIAAELARTNEAIRAAVPGAQIPYFRAPGGAFTDRLVSVAASAGMTSLYWEVDPRDWFHPKGESDAVHVSRVVDTVKRHARAGSIVLSHDFNQPDTITAYRQLLPYLTHTFRLGLPPRPVEQPPASPGTPTSGPTPQPGGSSTPPPAEPSVPAPTGSPGP
jgi:peptidoglycan-N-acetylglucosamine deacetylase